MAYGQSCLPDSIYKDSAFSAYPKPIVDGVGKGIDKPVCINKPYEFTLTMVIPDTMRFSGFLINLSQVSIPATGGIANLPKGLNYVCNPPTCIFPKKTMGCLKLYGTADNSNTPGIYKPSIKLLVGSLLGNIEVDYPGPLIKGEYLLTVLDENCLISTKDINIVNDNFFPNPTDGWINSREDNIFDLRLTDLNGKVVKIQSNPIDSKFLLPESLNNGFYFLSWKSKNNSYIQKVLLNRN